MKFAFKGTLSLVLNVYIKKEVFSALKNQTLFALKKHEKTKRFLIPKYRNLSVFY